jgi:FkbM family methyltransferase
MFNWFMRSLPRAFGLGKSRYRKRPGKLAFLKQYQVGTVLDIGANVGQTALEIRPLLRDAQIYSFEPLSECFQKLSSAMAGDTKFKAFPFALGAKNEQIAIHKSAYSPASSLIEMGKLHKEAFPHSAESKDERVEVRRLDDVAPELNLKDDVLIKMDVQGFESKVIDGGEKTMRAARVVILENSFYELYVSQALFDELYERMKRLGFSYRGSIGQKLHPKTGVILFEDSVFIRA